MSKERKKNEGIQKIKQNWLKTLGSIFHSAISIYFFLIYYYENSLVNWLHQNKKKLKCGIKKRTLWLTRRELNEIYIVACYCIRRRQKKPHHKYTIKGNMLAMKMSPNSGFSSLSVNQMKKVFVSLLHCMMSRTRERAHTRIRFNGAKVLERIRSWNAQIRKSLDDFKWPKR